ncbi:HNH endonuclease [Lentibacter sp. XHP0401]|jgi:putative restriction endonuclease|uniref:HNH endonuclease n=1 Tax=Lentibacter sp. XHP0401 TaxID=2984334 RepID=UPI0021E75FBF|nr:HNH endonuclease [Lentibacter sp. XHP0401]MCV2893457.1 HNH endonuclease [Lentibacter sp. XHP0401]
MANAVFIQNPGSIYRDEPGIVYHFPKRYLGMVEECLGDWIVIYEGRKGAFGYTSVLKVATVVPDHELEGHYYAYFERGTEWQFEQVVPRSDPMGIAYETSLRGPDGAAISGGASVSAVRRLSFAEFGAIVSAGLKPLEGPEALPREAGMEHAFAEAQAPFESAVIVDIRDTVLTSRLKRDASFARNVKAAYKGRCAISGLDLRNGGGRAEVQAAHIRPVADKGPDSVINGLALSGTLHWMFDRGLISVGEKHEILVSDNKVPAEVRQRLISPTGKLHLPEDARHHPHPAFLKYHRENIYGMTA